MHFSFCPGKEGSPKIKSCDVSPSSESGAFCCPCYGRVWPRPNSCSASLAGMALARYRSTILSPSYSNSRTLAAELLPSLPSRSKDRPSRSALSSYLRRSNLEPAPSYPLPSHPLVWDTSSALLRSTAKATVPRWRFTLRGVVRTPPIRNLRLVRRRLILVTSPSHRAPACRSRLRRQTPQ